MGGLDLNLSEGDIVTIFSQFGEPTHINLIRDKDTGKSKGYGFLKYEDQRSTDLAVDNMSGSVVVKGGMQLRVEHARYEKRKREGEEEEEMDNVRWDKVLGVDKAIDGKNKTDDESESDRERKERKRKKPLLKDETDLDEKDVEDPMRHYFAEKTEVDEVVDERSNRHKHRHRHRDRNGHRDDSGEKGSHHHGHRGNDSKDMTESRERRHRTDKRRRSKDRRRSENRDVRSVSPARHHHRQQEGRRHRSRDRNRRD